MKILQFNRAGTERFREFVAQAKEAKKAGREVEAVPAVFLTSSELTEETVLALPEVPSKFATKRELAEFIARCIPEMMHEDMRVNAGLWTWLAAKLFDQITANRTKIKEERAYVAGLTYEEFYRHLILGPYFTFFMARDNPERVRVLLYDEPTTMNEVMVQFGSYQTLMQNKSLQQVIQQLYYDPDRCRIKRGAGGKGAGTPRRLMSFFRQIELNYDLRSISTENFWSMLPSEFDKFKIA